MTCIFCEIVEGRAPASRVYEDDRLLAFMDIRPVNPGHLLVIPKRHAAELSELSASESSDIFQRAISLAAALRESGLRCEGVDLFLADGEAAGQEVFHVHLHVIPRYHGDGFRISAEGWKNVPDRGELDEAATRIAAALGG